MEALNGNPVFCVVTKLSDLEGRNLFINLKSTDKVEEPGVDFDEDQLVKEMCNPSPTIENFKVPLKLSQIYWSKTTSKVSGRHYVIDAHMNDKFAIRRVLVSDVVRHFVIIATMMAVEEKYNDDKSRQTCGQFIGHRMGLLYGASGYKVLKNKQYVERSNELVNNKITLIDECKADNNDDLDKNKTSETQCYDLYFRPTSRLLTCFINTDRLPDSIKFNDDRVVIEVDEKILMDIHLPFNIDLNEPVKYKFDDKLCLFRAVFKISE